MSGQKKGVKIGIKNLTAQAKEKNVSVRVTVVNNQNM
jgi:hypothetical protein